MALKTRFSLFTGLLVTMMLAATGFHFLTFEKQDVVKETRENQIALVKSLARVGKDSLLRKDDLFLINYINTVKEGNKTVAYALFVDEDNRILAHSNSQLLRQFVKDPIGIKAQLSQDLTIQSYQMGSEEPRQEIVDVALPVFLGKERKATARVGFSKTVLEEVSEGALDKTGRGVLGEYEKAITELKGVLELDRNHLEAKQQIKETKEEMQQRIKEEVERLYTRGLKAYSERRLEEVVREWEGALKLDPGNEKIRKALEGAEKELKLVKIRKDVKVIPVYIGASGVRISNQDNVSTLNFTTSDPMGRVVIFYKREMGKRGYRLVRDDYSPGSNIAQLLFSREGKECTVSLVENERGGVNAAISYRV